MPRAGNGSQDDFANRIANAALDMLLLKSGLGDLLTMLENLLNGDLFGFKIPLVGNLGFGVPRAPAKSEKHHASPANPTRRKAKPARRRGIGSGARLSPRSTVRPARGTPR